MNFTDTSDYADSVSNVDAVGLVTDQFTGYPVALTVADEGEWKRKAARMEHMLHGPKAAPSTGPVADTTVANTEQTPNDSIGAPDLKPLPLGFEMTGRLGADVEGDEREWGERHAKWLDQVYYDPTILTGIEGGGSVSHN